MLTALEAPRSVATNTMICALMAMRRDVTARAERECESVRWCAMTRRLLPAALMLALPLASCDAPSNPPGGGKHAGALGGPGPNSVAEMPPVETAAPGHASRAPDLSPPDLTPEAEESVKGARNILLSFARAMELGHYDQARSFLSVAGQRRWTRQQFAAALAGLGDVTVAIPSGIMEEEATGSARYTAPVTITGTAADGRPVRIEGTAILRRVAATAGERGAWQFETLTLDWTH